MPASTFISGRARVVGAAVPAVLLVLLLGSCSAAGRRIERDPYFESFFEKARLIMSAEEAQIYNHLPDSRAKEEFIDEFWRKRDTVPETEENETKIEFERRIAYANRWFRENRPSGRGWDTPRGRILIQLGEPDNRYLTDHINSPDIKGYERWIYEYYQMQLVFIDRDGFGEFKLQNPPPELLTAIGLAKFALVPSGREGGRKALAFDAGFRDGQVTISIPLKRVRFAEDQDSIRADYKITVTAYRDYAKVGSETFTKKLSFSKDDIPAGKDISFSLPFALKAKGKYYLEVLIEDVLTGSRALDFVDFKI